MTKIYILSTGCYEDYNIQFVTLDTRKAEKAVKLYGYELEVREDSKDWMPFTRVIALDEHGKIVADDKIYPTRTQPRSNWYTVDIEETHHIGQEEQIWYVTTLRCQAYGKTRQEALKLAKLAFKDKSKLPTVEKPRRKQECPRINHLFDAARIGAMMPSITGTPYGLELYPTVFTKAIAIGDKTPQGICTNIRTEFGCGFDTTIVSFYKAVPAKPKTP